MAEQTTQTNLKIDPQNLDFATYRLSGSNCLSDEISTPLSLALTMINCLYENPDQRENLIPVLPTCRPTASASSARNPNGTMARRVKISSAAIMTERPGRRIWRPFAGTSRFEILPIIVSAMAWSRVG